MEMIQEIRKFYLKGPERSTGDKKKKQRKLPLPIVGARLYFGILGRVYPKLTNEATFRTFLTPRKYPIADKKREAMEKAEGFKIKQNGKEVQGYRWGQGSRKVLLVHGWESHAGDFYNFVTHLTEADYSVFAMDAPAHGWSGGSTTNIIEYKEFLKQMITLQNHFDYIITHSLGGMAIGFLLQEMPQVNPEKIVFISPPSTLNDVIKDYSKLLWIAKENEEYLRKQIMKLSGRQLEEFDMAHLSKTMDPKKVMIVHDLKDRIVPIRYAESFHQSIPEALFLVTENFGHNKTMRDPLIINKVLEFISGKGN